MHPAAISGLTAFFVALVTTPLAGRLAKVFGVLDIPDERKCHGRPVPMLGGVGIFAGTAAGLFAGGVAGEFAWVFAAATAVFAIGLVEDAIGVPPWARLACELAAASAVVVAGTRATFLVGLAWLTIPVTVVWIAGMANSFNFLDNMDGLSGGVAVISAGTFLLICLQTGQHYAAAALAAVAGGALGFLPFNIHPARVFMGDAGALFLGFMLGALSVEMTFYEYHGTPLPLAAPLLVLAIPLFDTLTVLWFRFREGRPLTMADRNHFSHRLVALGMSEREAVGTIWLASATVGLGAVLLKNLDWAGGALLLVQALGVFSMVLLMERAGRRRQ